MSEYHYPQSTCIWCEEKIWLIPTGDGLWIHGEDCTDQTTLCDRGNRVEAGIMRTANPGTRKIIRHPEDMKSEQDHLNALVDSGVAFVVDLVDGMADPYRSTILWRVADELYELDASS